VPYFGLDFVDARNVNLAALPDRLRRLCRNYSILGQRLARSGLDFQPHTIFIFITPDLAHLRPCITCDQCRNPLKSSKPTILSSVHLRIVIKHRKELMSDVITIANFSEPLEAEMARLRLQSAGIETFLSGENARILEPGLGPLQLQVSSEDEADARAILADPGTYSGPGIQTE